jgi:hypothetical protein
MKNTDFTKATSLARKAGNKVYLYRTSLDILQLKQVKLNEWCRIFDPTKVLLTSLAALALSAVDCFLMMPLHRQASEVLYRNPNAINWVIALSFALFVVVCSGLLANTKSSGPLYNWNLLRKKAWGTPETAFLEIENEMATNKLNAILGILIYSILIGFLFWMKFEIVKGMDPSDIVHKTEMPIAMLGVLCSYSAMFLGMYLEPVFNYIFIQWQIWSLTRYLSLMLQTIAKQDHFVHVLWLSQGKPLDMVGIIKCDYHSSLVC